MALLELEDVHTYYGEAHILQGVSLSVGEGEVVSLIGRNGAGKTTTLLSIMGIARPTRGRVRLRGEDITRLETHQIVRRGIAWIPEERRVLPNLTVRENLRLAVLGTGAAREDATPRLAEVFRYFPRLETVADKLLWGTDWPGPRVPGMRENLDQFLALDLADGVKRKLLQDNPDRLFGPAPAI